jgi:sarcosine oxidase/L-pipecolate oxidase
MLEATAGSVATILLPPQDEAPELWTKYAPESWPVVSWNAPGPDEEHNFGSIYVLPRTESGLVKIGYRGTKASGESPDGTLTCLD